MIHSVEPLQQIDVVDAGNQISLLSYLLQTYFIYRNNSANKSLLLEMVSANVLVCDAVVNDANSSGKYLLQIFAKAIFIEYSENSVSQNFLRSSDIYLTCCKVRNHVEDYI